MNRLKKLFETKPETDNYIRFVFGGVVFLISFFIYVATLQPTTSLWDCGEFIASANHLQVTHPPGAPFFILLGRLFAMIPFAGDIGFRVNMLSAFTCGLTILFLFLIAVRLIENIRDKKENSLTQNLQTYFAASIGALSLAFADSFWYNAVETEVYALALFLTALLIWLAIVWYDKSAIEGSEKYLLLIAYVIGLSLGVHLYGVLAIIPITMLVIFKKYFTDYDLLKKSAILFATHTVILIIVASYLWWTIKANRPLAPEELSALNRIFMLYLGVASLIFIVIFRKSVLRRGSFYLAFIVGVLLMIAVYPGVMYFMKLVEWLSGNNTLLAIVIVLLVMGGLLYAGRLTDNRNKPVLNLLLKSLLLILLGFSSYTTVVIRSNQEPPINFNTPQTVAELNSYIGREAYEGFPIFKRRWSTNQSNFKIYLNYANDFEYMREYQIDHMFHRYILWNYAGRESYNHDAGVDIGKLFAIPFLVGLFGLYYYFRKDWKLAVVMLFIFFFFGYLMNYYANFQESQIRERDYFFVGAFFVFSTWIALGVRGILEYSQKIKNKSINNITTAGVYTIAILLIPINLLVTNYHTHDRSDNYFPRDFAYNTLQSLEENAILFTAGDNDSFPIWYLQDVEGYRKDVRVINLGLVDTKWYFKQLKETSPRGAATVEMSLTDTQMENIAPVPWTLTEVSLPVDEKAIIKFSVTDTSILKNRKISWKLLPTVSMGNQTYLSPENIIVKDIIENNAWKSPIYFASTCQERSKLGLSDYLRMDGLAFQLLPIKNDTHGDYNTSSPMMERFLFGDENIEQQIILRGLNDPDVFFDEDNSNLVRFYRYAYLTLAQRYIRIENKVEDGLQVLTEMEKQIPRNKIPFDYWQKIYYSDLFYSAGDMNSFNELASEIEEVCMEKISKDPFDYEGMRNPYQTLFVIFNKQKDYVKALRLAERFLYVAPNNQQVKQMVNDYQALVGEPGSTSVTEE